MSERGVLIALASELENELTQRILPYWMTHAVDEARGGYVGLIDADGITDPRAPKAAILNARILWTFSAAQRVLGLETYRVAAERALCYLRAHFIDRVHGGVYWMVDAEGGRLDERKHVYAQAFAIYALSEHFRATGDDASLHDALRIYRLVERYAYDAQHGGYEEAFSRDWQLLDDVRLSAEDADERKSMNTHLHLLEAYTNLCRVWPEPLLRRRIRELLEIFLAHIVDAERGHVRAFFHSDWSQRSSTISYGHDIEASWLLLEAAYVVGDDLLHARVRNASLKLADAVLNEAVDSLGGGIYETGPKGAADTDKEWWPQAEAIVGFVNAYQESGRVEFLQAAWDTWMFTKRFVLDTALGEWRRRVERDGTPRPGHEKVGPWKCPYHNARACLEIMARAVDVVHGSPEGAGRMYRVTPT